MNLSLAITDRGVTVIGVNAILYPEDARGCRGETRPPTIPCKSGGVCAGVEDYDWTKLTGKLNLVAEKDGRRGCERHPRSRQPNQVRGNHVDDGREPG